MRIRTAARDVEDAIPYECITIKLKEIITMEALLNILSDLHPDVDFDTCTTLIDDKILDSFDIVTLVAEIDAEYDVAIPAEELVPENFNSAEALYALIEKLLDE